MAKTYIFETETCGRCVGTGKYSYCQAHGSTCFGCGGTGVRLTKRGAAAKAFYDESRKVRLGDLKVGDMMQVHGLTVGGSGYRYFAKVVEISGPEVRAWSVDTVTGERTPHEMITVSTQHATYGRSGLVATGDTMVIKGFSAEEKAELIAAAKAYQATLTQSGKPRKRLAA